jgi:hypothetical protein
LLPAVRPVVGNNGFGAGYHMIYAPAAYVVTFARLYSYGYSSLYVSAWTSVAPDVHGQWHLVDNIKYNNNATGLILGKL